MILVVGATGDLGQRVARIQRAKRDDVRCMVRPGSDDSALRAMDAEVVPGDLTVPETLPPACAGATVVVATPTAIGRVLAGTQGPTIREVDEVGMAGLVSAAETAGVERFVYTSFAGVDASVGTSLTRAKLTTKRRLAASVMRTVVVRTDAFQEIHLGPTARFDVAAGKVAVIGRGDRRQRWISTQDVASLVAGLAEEPEAPGMVTVGGPAALSKNEAVAIVETVTGRKLKVQHMPLFVAAAAIRLLDKRNDALASALGAGPLQDTRTADWDDAPLRERGIEPQSASVFLREQARRAMQQAR